MNEKSFEKELKREFEKKLPNFSPTLNIAIIGKVSSGKTSVFNAWLGRTRENVLGKVLSKGGSSLELNPIPLDEEKRIWLLDSPGLDDVKSENSQITLDFINNSDVGIFVVTEAANDTQKKYFDDFNNRCQRVFVVLNKIDYWDNYRHKDGKNPALETVVDQWKEVLKVNKIYQVCAFGYDEELPEDTELNIRGIEDLKEDIDDFLATKGKDILLARYMDDKRSKATKIIASALVGVTGAAFAPATAISVALVQCLAIASLYNLYTGKNPSFGSVLIILTTVASESLKSTLVLWVSTLLPPTGIFDGWTAVTAIIVTMSMLAAVNSLLAKGTEIQQKELLKSEFRKFKTKVERSLSKELIKSNWKNQKFFQETVTALLKE